MILPAHAQSGGESIIFVKPAGAGTSSSDSNPILSEPARSLDLSFVPHEAFQKPMPAGNFSAMSPRPVILPPAQNNGPWTLMTPEQILNMPSPEKMFGLPDPDDSKTPEERYLDRMQATATNQAGLRLSGSFAALDASDSSSSLNPLSHLNDQSGEFDSSKVFNPFMQSSANTVANGSKSQQSGPANWGNAFSFPAPTPKPDAEQVAEMQRFAALLGTAPAPVATATPLPPPSSSSSGSQLGQYDILGRPLVQTYDPSKPSGLKPLLEQAGYYQPAAPVKKPAWKPQPPPWLSDQPSATPTAWKF